jgi:ATP phosphoribosyltransferase
VMESVVAARDKRYLMLNSPDGSLETVIGLLPGLESPTVLPLARSGMHAVHAVVDRHQVVELLGPLRAAGASSILVLPIENLVP